LGGELPFDLADMNVRFRVQIARSRHSAYGQPQPLTPIPKVSAVGRPQLYGPDLRMAQPAAYSRHSNQKLTTPAHFRAYLARRWAEGCTLGRALLAEIRPLGYTGSLTHLQRLLKTWRQPHFVAAAGLPVPQAVLEDTARQTVPPIVAAALCIKPRGC
jgi:hypothetical protein